MAVGYRYAFSLSKQQLRDQTPPGTVDLIAHDLERTATGTDHTVDHIKLLPQPSNDPADPLNWPMWRKIAILWSCSYYAFVNDFVAASPASAFPVMAVVLRKSFDDLTHLIAVAVLMAGAANMWWVPLANTYGRRPVLLFCTLLMTFSTMWCGITDSFNSLLAARVIQGIGIASSEAVAPDVVGEVFFIHQRGRAMAVYTVFLAMGSLTGGTCGGFIAGTYGYKYIFWIGTALSAASVLFVFFLQPETLYGRETRMVTPPARDNEMLSKGEASKEPERSDYPHRPFTFIRSLHIGVNRGHLLQAFCRPWLSLLFPGTWLVMLHYGGLVGGIVITSTVGPTLLSEPPYSWGSNVGLLNIGGLIGTALGGGYAYLTVDKRLTSTASHKTNGHAESESRLPLLFFPLFIATIGMWIFGFCAQYPAPGRWVGLEFGLGMLAFGLMSVPSIGFNYIIDSYNSISGDCFTMIVSFRAIIGFSWTFFVGDWVTERGPAQPFGIFGMLLAIFSLLTVPQWLFGKRTRIATERWLPQKADH